MFKTIKNAFKTPDVRKRILYTLLLIVIFRLGCYISIPGTVTFKNNKKTREVAKEIPLEYLLIETDSPYLAPEPVRGTQNTPANVKFVAQKIAEAKGLSLEEVEKMTFEKKIENEEFLE